MLRYHTRTYKVYPREALNEAGPKASSSWQDEGVSGEGVLNGILLVRLDAVYPCVFWAASHRIRILQAMKAEVPFDLLAATAFMTPFQAHFNIMAYIFWFCRQGSQSWSRYLFFWIKNAL